MGELAILAIAGSLRKDSYNKALIRAAEALVPAGVVIKSFDLGGIPLFNQDWEADPAESVVQFRAAIQAADAILIATPEYNYSIPGVLKNALDVASRPYGQSVLDGKPVAIMGASIGTQGTIRGQSDLRRICALLNMIPLNRPEVFVSSVTEKVDESGNINDLETQQQIKQLLEAFTAWIQKIKG